MYDILICMKYEISIKFTLVSFDWLIDSASFAFNNKLDSNIHLKFMIYHIHSNPFSMEIAYTHVEN